MQLGDLSINALRAIAVPFGLLWGSFLNVVIYRTPRDMSVVRPGSHCPACGKPVAPYDNVPVLSFLILRGRARCCGAKIGWRYPLVELLGGAASLAVLELCVAPLGPHASALRALVVYLADFATVLGLIAAAFIDFEFMYIPDFVTLGGTAIGIATASLRGGSLLGAAIGAAAGFLVTYVPFIFLYRIVRGRPGMGMGDAKLLMMAGAYFGLFGIFWTLLAGAVQGALGAFVVWLVRGRIALPEGVQEELEELKKAAEAGDEEAKQALEDDPLAQEHDPDEVGLAHFAFGPFLALAFIEYLLLGTTIGDLAHQMFFI